MTQVSPRIGILFPGQGSQSVGMGRDLHRASETAREYFEIASECSRHDLVKYAFKGPHQRLSRTEILQPAMTAVCLSVLDALIRRGIRVHATAGHSLGEFSSLACCGSLSPRQALELTSIRGALMGKAADLVPGSMAAVTGLDDETVRKLIQDTADNAIVVANINSPDQRVISGPVSSLRTFRKRVLSVKGRWTDLSVSGAWHSPMMQPVHGEWCDHVNHADINEPDIPIVFNASGYFRSDPEQIRREMKNQLISPVLWTGCMNKLIQEGVNVFIEAGPGKVLRHLLRKIHPSPEAYRVFSIGDIRSMDIMIRTNPDLIRF